jgi:hypothetical protein
MKRQYETFNIIQEPGTPLKLEESETIKREFFGMIKKGLKPNESNALKGNFST